MEAVYFDVIMDAKINVELVFTTLTRQICNERLVLNAISLSNTFTSPAVAPAKKGGIMKLFSSPKPSPSNVCEKLG